MSGDCQASVIIFGGSHSGSLERVVRSALEQTVEAVEVILVSSSAADESLRKISDSRFRLLPAVGAPSQSLNEAVTASRGSVLLFLDERECLLHHAVATIQSVRQAETAFILFRVLVENGQGVSIGMDPPETEPIASGLCGEELLRRGVIQAASEGGRAYVRTALEKILPVPDEVLNPLDYLEDGIAFCGEAVAVDFLLSSRRQGDGLPSYEQLRLACDRMKVRQHQLERLAQPFQVTVPDDWANRSLNRLLLRMAVLKWHADSEYGKRESHGKLVEMGLRAIWFYSGWGYGRRIMESLWLVCFQVAPEFLATGLWRKWRIVSWAS